MKSSKHKSLKAIENFLKSKELEDFKVLKQIENILKTKRGYVFRMPAKNKPVILQISGGIDSISMVSLLIEKFGLIVYPLYINRGQERVKNELKSLVYFDKFFKKKYANNYRSVFILNTKIPPWEIRKTIIKFGTQTVTKNSNRRWGIFSYSSLLASFSAQYAEYLELEKIAKIRTIFCAAVEGDGSYVAHHTLTAMRGVTLNLCTQTNDYSWQFTSPLIEKELKMFQGKEDLIIFGTGCGLPLYKTWSCYKNHQFHCGVCDSCSGRKLAFRNAKIKDQTFYLSDHSWRRILLKKFFFFLQ